MSFSAAIDDPLHQLVAAIATHLEHGTPVGLRTLARELGYGYGTAQRLYKEALRRQWLTDTGVPTVDGLIACGRI